jgi:hypothetical protein
MSDEKAERFADVRQMTRAEQIVTTAAIGALSPEEHEKFFERFYAAKDGFTVTFAVNGFPIPFSAFVRHLDEGWDAEVRDAAAKMIVGKATELQRKIERLDAVMRSVEGEVHDAVREEFPDADLTDRE